jgi:type I restriction enzyme, R subunit
MRAGWGVVEAKAWGKALTEGVAQAKEYAGKLAVRFTYASNGQGVYWIDMETGKEGEIAAYSTPDELWTMTFGVADDRRDRFAAVAFADKSGRTRADFGTPKKSAITSAARQ